MKRSKIIFLIFDILLITSTFLFFIWLKPASLRIYLPTYYKPFLGFAFIWLVASFIGDKFNVTNKKQLKDLLNPIFRIDITILAIAVTLIYIFNRFSYSRMIVLGTILSATVLEIIFVILYYLHRKIRNGFDNPITLSVKPKFITPIELLSEDEKFDFKLPEIKNIDETIYPNLKNRYLINNVETFDFIEQNLNLYRIKKSESFILHTHTFFNIENVEPASHQLFINLHKINDVRRINRYLIQVNKNLKYEGYFIGNCETLQERYKKYFNNFPFIVAAPLYLLDFTHKRIFPKIPILKEIYFALSKGENRAISQAEILGRLYFCGFRVIATAEINNLFHFIAVKVREPKEDPNPSYSPFIKLRRVGQDGELFYVYKFRTMHPYSEYLQNYIYDQFGTIDGDGFRNDFRITSWGRIFRRLWIDELPMLINLFRGDVKLVGVRPLSTHKFSLYTKELQIKRVKFKPGLVPPFFVDLPNSLQELMTSEINYLNSYEKKRFMTDFSYFFRAFYNIIFRNARSK